MPELELSPPRIIWHKVILNIGVNYVRRIVFIRVNQIDIDLSLEDLVFTIEGLEKARDKLMEAIVKEAKDKAGGKVALGHLSKLADEKKKKEQNMGGN